MTTITLNKPASIVTHSAAGPPPRWNDYAQRHAYDGFHLRSEWGRIFESALRHEPHFLWATSEGKIVGVLPLLFVSGPIFGRFLVSQPYLNTGGVLADSEDIAQKLIDEAVELSDRLNVKHLELRHEQHVEHPRLNATATEKVHMRLALPATVDELWDGLKSKVRSQVRKPRNNIDLTHQFGRFEQLDTFYDIFCRNMRDLGTPPFPKSLFRCMLEEFGDEAEICTVHFQGTPVASGFLLAWSRDNDDSQCECIAGTQQNQLQHADVLARSGTSD